MTNNTKLLFQLRGLAESYRQNAEVCKKATKANALFAPEEMDKADIWTRAAQGIETIITNAEQDSK